MRKLWFRRRGVSEIIAGIIILVIFLIALAAMIAVSSQYDVYESVFSGSQQREINMYSENLLGAYPGVINGTNWQISNCGGSTCYNYTILLNNVGIGVQIARIYINTTGGPSGCTGLCVLDAAYGPAPNKFRASDSYINAGESYHPVVVWLPVKLPTQCGGSSTGCSTIKVTTMRGRTFVFMYPFPFLGGGPGVSQGGTGIYIGPLVITFERTLITYTTPNLCPTWPPPQGQFCNPPIPIGGTNGYWVVPQGTAIIFYVKIQTDAKAVNDVYLTAQSVFELALFSSSGGVNYFFIIAPITKDYCLARFNTTAKVNCETSYGYDNSRGNTGDPNQIVPYLPCAAPPPQYNTGICSSAPYYSPGASGGPRYLIPRPTVADQRGKPVIVAFAAKAASGGSNPQPKIEPSWKTLSVTTFLGLSFVYDDGSGSYVYGVTFPFIAMCVNDPETNCNV